MSPFSNATPPEIPYDSGSPVGAVIAYAGYIGPPQSLPAESTNYNTGIAPEGFGLSAVEPYNWMVCDGRTLYIKDYPKLFLKLGFRYNQKGDEYPPDTPFGSGDFQENATFRIPDYRGYFLRMVSGTGPWLNSEENPDPTAGKRTLPNDQTDSGVGSIEPDTLQEHMHGYSKAEKAGKPTDKGDALLVPIKENSLTSGAIDALPPTKSTVRTSSETRPKNMYVYYLIKFS